jgi:HAD superfamily hydrolase (TIGR01490 family)
MATTFSEENKMGNNYIAFFDLDHTLLSLNSGRALIKQAYEAKMINRSGLIKVAIYSLFYKLNLADPISLLKRVVLWVKDQDEETLQNLVNDVFEKHLKLSVRKEVVEEIEFHRRHGAILVILSSSIPPICKAVAVQLKLDDILCSELEVSNGIFTGQLKGEFCLGEGKVRRIKEYCNKMSLKEEDSYYYGDSIEDYPALKIIGNPVCVSPDKKLKKIALKAGWKII